MGAALAAGGKDFDRAMGLFVVPAGRDHTSPYLFRPSSNANRSI